MHALHAGLTELRVYELALMLAFALNSNRDLVGICHEFGQERDGRTTT